jgi:phospholipase/carboxylesterase
MKHLFEKGNSSHTFVLLHGTGGNEHDLLPIANRIDSQASILSVRGNVLENGMARFFKRLKPGVFDEEDLILRTTELKSFIDDAANKYQFDRNQVIVLGYSNGANIASSLIFHYPKIVKAAILHHPMVPIRGLAIPDLSNTPIFIGAGENDPICPIEETMELKSLYEASKAKVEMFWGQSGHQLTIEEVMAASKWYSKIIGDQNEL